MARSAAGHGRQQVCLAWMVAGHGRRQVCLAWLVAWHGATSLRFKSITSNPYTNPANDEGAKWDGDHATSPRRTSKEQVSPAQGSWDHRASGQRSWDRGVRDHGSTTQGNAQIQAAKINCQRLMLNGQLSNMAHQPTIDDQDQQPSINDPRSWSPFSGDWRPRPHPSHAQWTRHLPWASVAFNLAKALLALRWFQATKHAIFKLPFFNTPFSGH